MTDSFHTRSAAQRFSRSAPTYDDRATVQAEVAERLLAVCRDVPAPRHILEAGCGTGLLTRLLRGRFPHAKIIAFDRAPTMVEAARRRFAGDPRVRVEVADFRSPPAGPLCALVVSSSALHWADSPADAVAALAARVTPDGILAAALMLDGTLAELRAARAAAAPDNPPRRTLPSPDEARAAFHAAGLRIETELEDRLTARHADTLEFLESLRRQGLTGGDFSRGARPLARGALARLAAEYELRFPHPDGGIRATYHVAWYRARRV